MDNKILIFFLTYSKMDWFLFVSVAQYSLINIKSENLFKKTHSF